MMFKYETSKFSKEKWNTWYSKISITFVQKFATIAWNFMTILNHLLQVLGLVVKYLPFSPPFSQTPIIVNLKLFETWNSKFFPCQCKWPGKLSSHLRIWPDKTYFWPDIVRWPAVIWNPGIWGLAYTICIPWLNDGRLKDGPCFI